MKISTFSIVVGTKACNAHCPFCISHSTGFEPVSNKDIRWDSFGRAIALARKSGTTTLLLTGKGEPTLYPDEISLYLEAIRALSPTAQVDGNEIWEHAFPMIELQTNAIGIGEAILSAEVSGGSAVPFEISERQRIKAHNEFRIGREEHLLDSLKYWKKLGLTTVAISTVGINPVHNKAVYLHHCAKAYPDLAKTVEFLHSIGLQVRLCVMMQQGMVCLPEHVKEIVDWCRGHKVEQLTVRPIRRPTNKTELAANETDRYIQKFGLDAVEEKVINEWVAKTGHHIYTFSAGEHLFKVYDIDGQNICLADCLTVSTEPDTIRTLIWYPRSGEIAYHWQYESARL